MRNKRNGSFHRRRNWECPYFKWDGECCVSCTAGKAILPSKKRTEEFLTNYCAGKWRECNLAKEWNEYYERYEDQQEAKVQYQQAESADPRSCTE